MDLVIHQVGQLHHVDNTHCYRIIEGFTGTSVIEDGLAIPGHAGFLHHIHNLDLTGTVENGVATCKPKSLAAIPRCVSSTCPMFIRDGTLRG